MQTSPTLTGASQLPPDDLSRELTVRSERDNNLAHVAVVGDTYTILLSGEDTAGRFSLVDVHVPPGKGPPPHRHDFEEAYVILEGEIEATFRGEKRVLKAGETINIPANAPHTLRNASGKSARVVCICAPAGHEKFLQEVGIPVATRTTAAPHLSEEDEAALVEKAVELAPRYRTELMV